MKQTEHQIQSSFFEWLRYKYPQFIDTMSIFAIPNGGKRHVVTAIKLKKEGVQSGVWDVFCAIPHAGKHGLFLEFKAGKNKLTDNQNIFMNNRLMSGYACEIVYSLDEAIVALNNYLIS
jgi:hypothetical protein